MKQKIPTNVGTAILVIIAITVGAFIWQYEKGQPDIAQVSIQTNAEIQKNNQQNNIEDSISKQDAVLIDRSGVIYEANIESKELKLYDNPVVNPAEFSGLPKETKNKQISVVNRARLVSQDKTKVIIVSITSDETKEPSEFDGSLPILSASEFVCEVATKKCLTTDYLASAYAASNSPGVWYGYSKIWWLNWDSLKNILYGHLSGEGVGNASPVYTFNLNTKIIEKTSGYNSSNENEKRAEVPMGAFSPSLSKFVMVDENWNDNNSGGNWDLLLYDSNDLSKPLKKINVSSINDKSDRESRVRSVAWSVNEKTLVMETHKQIYTLDLDSGRTDLRYTDTTKDYSGIWLDSNQVDLSQSGRYIVFIDYDTRNTPYEKNKLNSVLRAIDLKDNNKVIELFREEGIRLNYLF